MCEVPWKCSDCRFMFSNMAIDFICFNSQVIVDDNDNRDFRHIEDIGSVPTWCEYEEPLPKWIRNNDAYLKFVTGLKDQHDEYVINSMLIENVEFSEIPDYGDHMTKDEFIECVKCGGFVDSDGYGNLATSDKNSNIEISPSDVRTLKWPNWCTHVVWYNR